MRVLPASVDYNFSMRHGRGFLLLLVAFSAALPLNASDFTLFGGFHHPGKVSLGRTSGDGGDAAESILSDGKDFGVLGARLFRSQAPLGFEHTLAYAPNFLDEQANALIYNSNLLVQIPVVTLQPYGTIGIGLVRAGGGGPGAFGAKFSINYGAGVKAWLVPPLGVRMDVRQYSIRGVEGQTLRVWEASAGLSFGF